MINLQQTAYESEMAERAVLGCVLSDPVKIVNLCLKNGISENTFYNRNTRCIWECIIELHQAGTKCDRITVTDSVTNKFRDEDIIFEIEQCMNEQFNLSHVMYYINIIRSKETKRELYDYHTESIENLPKLSAEEALSNAKFTVSNIKTNEVTVRKPSEIIKANEEKFKSAKGLGYTGLPTRWKPVQDKLCGSKPGKITVIAARPGEGKTVLGCNITKFLAENSIPSGIISIEMNADEIYDRLIADHVNIDISKFESGDYTERDMAKYKKAGHEIAKLPLYITDRNMNIAQICSWIQDYHVERGIRAVMIDYLQIIPSMPSKGRMQRNQEISEYTSALCNVAKRTGVHIYLLSQLNRVGATEIPALHHLRDSGSIEQDAHTVMFIYPDPQAELAHFDNDVPSIIDIAKNRGGKKGPVHVRFRKCFNKFITQTVAGQHAFTCPDEVTGKELPTQNETKDEEEEIEEF